ncbi:polysaccharide deacetylase family protein [Fontivita pretiosa]|uniref:polysaccharide deacetylase family protein n=1 Tax=Fontivita pretiosa TaxID=2989684 RepID=UPI003D186258
MILANSAGPILVAGSALAAAGLGGACAWAMIHPASRAFGPVYHCAAGNVGPRYALTFDDGPTDPWTGYILDALDDLNAPAAFFTIGANIRRSGHLLRLIHQAGHIVANHSLDHAHLGMFRGGRYWQRQIRSTDDLIEELIGLRPRLFRPPMGVKTPFICGAARRLGHHIITWTRRGLDGVPTESGSILQRLAPTTRPGDVLVLHDGIEPRGRRDPAATLAAIRPLVVALRDRGLEPARLDELLGLPAYTQQPGHARSTR